MPDKPKVRVFEVTPASRTDFDTLIISDAGSDKGWKHLLAEVELSLDRQWAEMEDGEMEWKDIKVDIRCSEKTEEEMVELEG